MTITVNGQSRDLDPGTTLSTVVDSVTTAESGVAVAVNDSVIPRQSWDTTELDEGDRVEVLTAVQGG